MNLSTKIKAFATTAAAFVGIVAIKAMSFGAGYGAVHAVTTYANQPTTQQYHDAMVEGIKKVKMPMKLDDITTLVAERADGLQMVYVYEISDPTFVIDEDKAQQMVTSNTCGQQILKEGFQFGATYRYEYKRDGKMLGAYNVDSCATATASATATSAFPQK